MPAQIYPAPELARLGAAHRGRPLPELEHAGRLGDRPGPRLAGGRLPRRPRGRRFSRQRRQHLLAEARQALLLQRVANGADAMTATEALRLATRGGAAVLGRDDIGVLAPGMAADLIGYRVDTLGFAGGAVHDPLAALVFCQPSTVAFSVIDGRVRVRDGQLVDIDLPPLIARHNALARAGAGAAVGAGRCAKHGPGGHRAAAHPERRYRGPTSMWV